MTKSIEDYPELKGWVTENVDVVCNSIGENCFHFFYYEPTTQKLLSMQATIDAQQERIEELESCLNEIVTDHCCRDSDSLDDLPLPPEDQDDALIGNAMKLLNKESK